MVKNLHYLTIKNFSLHERTGKARHLFWFGLPLGFLFKKKFNARVEDIEKKMGSSESNEKLLNTENHKTKSFVRIQYLKLLKLGIINILQNKIIIDYWISEAGKTPKGTVKNLTNYVNEVKGQTGIKIETLEDVGKLQKKIAFYESKYKEYFEKKETGSGGNKFTFMQIARSVFRVNEEDFNSKASMTDFFEMKEEAYQKVILLQSKSNG